MKNMIMKCPIVHLSVASASTTSAPAISSTVSSAFASITKLLFCAT